MRKLPIPVATWYFSRLSTAALAVSIVMFAGSICVADPPATPD